LKFKNYGSISNLVSTRILSCSNITDQFAVGNNKAKLTYPVGLINNEEWYNIGTSSLRQTGDSYWGLSPYYFYSLNACVRGVSADGSLGYYHVYRSHGSRPAVSLSTGAVISSGSGTGSENDPWVIE
jgi:hypothetical protein